MADDQQDQHQQDDQGRDDGQQDGGGPAREAQAQRARRREAETARDAAVAERDALAGRLEALQRGEVARLAGEVLADGDDLFTLGGAELADLLDDDGAVDVEAVRAAAQALVEQRGQRFARPRGAGGDWDGGPRQPPAPAAPGLGAVLQAAARDALGRRR